MSNKSEIANLYANLFTEDIYLIDQVSSSTVEEEQVVIERTEPSSTVEEPVPEEMNTLFEGSNQQPLMIVVDSSFSQDDRVFLAKVLSAVHIDLKNVALVKEQDFNGLSQVKGIEFDKVIFFGGNRPKEHELYLIYGEEPLKILYSESLDQFNEDRDRKRKLWDALKTMF